MFRAIIVNENTKHFREVNILEQTFDVYFPKKTSSARLDLRVIFDNYDEMDDLTYMHVKEPVELIFSMLENDK